MRSAFRANLLDEPSSTGVLGTQEIDAADVLEVTDLASAIARAEEALRARSSRAVIKAPDSDLAIFDSLLDQPPTDDAVGPAIHLPYRPTPLPPRTSSIPLPPGITRPATLLRAPDVMTTPIPMSNVALPPAARTAPHVALEEDAYYQPGGRIRTLADATLEAYRPEPTLLVRLRQRRTTLSWVVLLVLAPLALLAVFAVALMLGQASAPTAEPSSTSVKPTAAAATSAASAPPLHAAAPVAPSTPEIPVLDVNNLKSAPAKKARH